VLLGFRISPAILLAAFIANSTTAGSPATSLAIAVGNTLESVVGAYLINRWSGGHNTFTSPAGVAKFAVVCLVSTMLSASIGVGSLSATGYALWSDFVSIWITWWMGDLAGALVFTPVIVLWSISALRPPGRTELLQSVAAFAAAVAVGLVAFSPLLDQTTHRAPLAFLAVLPLIWAALRRNQRDTATVVLILSSFAVWGTISGGGPFSRGNLNDSILLLISFIIGISLPSLALSADVKARERVTYHQRFFHELSERLRTIADADAMLTTVAQALGQHLEASRSGYSEIDEEHVATVRAQWRVDGLPDLTGRYPLQIFGPAGIQALTQGRTIVIEDAEADSRTQSFISAYRSIGVRAAITVPVVKEAKLRAALHVLQLQPRQWTADEVTLCRDIAEQTWSAVTRARTESELHKEIVRRKHQETRLQATVQQLELVMAELSHRSKNLLSIIQAMALQTAKNSSSFDEFTTRFMGRIFALARSHDLLIKQDWQGAMLEEVIRIELEPFVDLDVKRFEVHGPAIMVKPEVAQNIGLAIHELATNASKYGALSNSAGRISIHWEIDATGEQKQLRLRWEERGGPLTQVPERRGFGSLVLERIAASVFHGRAALHFQPEGLIWTIEGPVAILVTGANA